MNFELNEINFIGVIDLWEWLLNVFWQNMSRRKLETDIWSSTQIQKFIMRCYFYWLGYLYCLLNKPMICFVLTMFSKIRVKCMYSDLAAVVYMVAFRSITFTLSWRRPLSYTNQSIDLLCKSMEWFLYDNGLRHERVK